MKQELTSTRRFDLAGLSARCRTLLQRRLPSLVGLGVALVTLCFYAALRAENAETGQVPSLLPTFVLGAGFLVAGLLARTIYLSQMARLRAEDLVRERDQLQALLDNVPDLIYFKDPSSRFTRNNRAHLHVLGVEKPDDALGKTDFDFFTPEHARAAYADEQMIVRSGRPLIDRIERIRGADGRFRWVSATKVPITDEARRVMGIVGISRDITERKQTEEALRESEARYRALVESLPLGVYEIDVAGELLSINQSGLRILELYEQPPAQGTCFIDALQEPHRSLMATLLARAATGETLEIEYSSSGTQQQRMLVTTLVPLRRADGAIHSIMGVIQDITERRQFELDAEIERYRLDAILESSSDGIAMADLERRLVLVNQMVSDFFNIPADEMVGMDSVAAFTRLGELIDEPEAFLALLPGLFTNSQNHISGTLFMRRPERRVVTWYSRPVLTRAGTSMGRLFLFRDTTDTRNEL